MTSQKFGSGRTKGKSLSLQQRVLVAVVYLVTLFGLLGIATGGIGFLTKTPLSVLFVSFALMLVLGTYVLEPFFARPADVFVNSIALLLALNGLGGFFGRNLATLLLTGALLLLALSALVLLIAPASMSGRWRQIFYRVVTRVGRSKVVFSAAYILLVTSYFNSDQALFWLLLGYLTLVVIIKPAEVAVTWISSLNRTRAGPNFAGSVSERIGLAQFDVVLPAGHGNARHSRLLLLETSGSAYLIVRVISAVPAASEHRTRCSAVTVDGNPVLFDTKSNTARVVEEYPPVAGAAFLMPHDEIRGEPAIVETVNNAGTRRVVGVIAPGTNSVTIWVDIFETEYSDGSWEEGAILETEIGSRPCMLQIVSAESIRSLSDDGLRHLHVRAYCVKLGRQHGQGFDPIPWIPSAGAPVFRVTSARPAQLAGTVLATIGHIPGIEQAVLLTDADRLVTHNSAVLGALGSGKTTMAVSLAASVVADTDVRVISIDVTSEHPSLFRAALGDDLVLTGSAPFLAGMEASMDSVALKGTAQVPHLSGNESVYRLNVRNALHLFLFEAPAPALGRKPLITGAKRVLVINPDEHEVTRGEKIGYQVIIVPLSAAEKARIISEEILTLSMELGLAQSARILLMLEEAHTLIPEFSFAAQDSDRSAANGTARVVLQGRKYGLGAMVIAQRTANVSKSVLSQCSSIFALRIFDDTGKAFLENFIGTAYANQLPQLAPFHAVVVGAGVGTEQPIMVRALGPRNAQTSDSALSGSQPVR